MPYCLGPMLAMLCLLDVAGIRLWDGVVVSRSDCDYVNRNESLIGETGRGFAAVYRCD